MINISPFRKLLVILLGVTNKNIDLEKRKYQAETWVGGSLQEEWIRLSFNFSVSYKQDRFKNSRYNIFRLIFFRRENNNFSVFKKYETMVIHIYKVWEAPQRIRKGKVHRGIKITVKRYTVSDHYKVIHFGQSLN